MTTQIVNGLFKFSRLVVNFSLIQTDGFIQKSIVFYWSFTILQTNQVRVPGDVWIPRAVGGYVQLSGHMDKSLLFIPSNALISIFLEQWIVRECI